MNFDSLIKQLDNPKPSIRIAALHIFNLVDEVRALDAISARVPLESDARVEAVLKQVGRSLNKLKREGYDTIEALCQHFNVYSEILSYADIAEIRRIQDMAKDKTKIQDSVDKAAAVLLAGKVVGAMPMTDSLSELTQNFSRRTRATRPTKEDFSRWLPLLKDPNPEERRQMLIHIANRNNPLALQYFAQVWVTDSETPVRETAKRFGKLLYWNTIYAQMEDDGSLAKLMTDYAANLGISLPTKFGTQEIKVENVPTIGEILKKAEEERRKRR
jgi:hypothetical protein